VFLWLLLLVTASGLAVFSRILWSNRLLCFRVTVYDKKEKEKKKKRKPLIGANFSRAKLNLLAKTLFV